MYLYILRIVLFRCFIERFHTIVAQTQPSTALQCPTPPHYAYYSSFTPLLDQLIDFSEEMDEHETKMEKARQDLEDACRYFRQAVNGQEEEDANNQDKEDNAQDKDAGPPEVDLTDQD